ncbi:hypothetical protein [Adhaeretor mobilis]|uniref:PEP-CTERM protein-sorting domain-containing protein n=1 Tax=Adhaeretor mobilis TaxID=1930276 RepID=A0A517MQ51_9BACT|nr:hypothetical protein [Adhaeretor mobilis]QDS97016.1 hypothetical protein HG15A2_02750 [Adhaeretor mobilis]
MNTCPKLPLLQLSLRALIIPFALLLSSSLAPAVTFTWNTDNNGVWNNPFNWTPFGVPNDAVDAAVLGGVITGPRTVSLASNATVGSLTFNNSNTFTLDNSTSTSEHLTLGGPFSGDAFLRVLDGNHVIEAPLVLAADTQVNINESSLLEVDVTSTSLNGPTLTKLGGGDLRIHQVLNLNSGTLLGKKGTISGTGEVFGNIDNSSATIAPGDDGEGTFLLHGDYAQGDQGRLEVELGGAGSLDYDRFTINGSASLDGDVRVLLSPGFTPSAGDQFTVMTYGSKSGAFDDILLPSLSSGLKLDAIVESTQLQIRAGKIVNWTGGGGVKLWNAPGNWQFGEVPDDDFAVIDGAGTTTIVGSQLAPILGLQLTGGRHLSIQSLTGAGMLDVAGTVSLDPTASLSIAGSISHLKASTVKNQGGVLIDFGASLSASHKYLQTGGSTTLDGVLSADLVQIDAGTISGAGTVDGSLAVGTASTTAKLLPGNGLGTFNVDNDLTLGPNAELFIEIDASGSAVVADQLVVGGTVTLGGTLNLDLVAGSTIPFSNPVQILQADNLGGNSRFDDITGLATPEGSLIVTFLPGGSGSYTTISLHLSQELGDMNGDGDVDTDDATMFAWAIRDADTYYDMFILGGGGADDKMADMDFDTELTFADIPLFLAAVELSGGAVAAATSAITSVLNAQTVPEPNTMLLALVGLSACSVHRRERQLADGW